MPVKYIVEHGLLKKIQVDDAGNPISTPASTPASTLADPNKALTFSSNFTDASNAAEAAGTQLAPSTMQALETVQSPEYLNKFGNRQVVNTAIYDLTNEIFTKLQAPIGLLNKLLVLQNYNINIKIDDSGSMQGERWWQAKIRLLEMMDVLQVVPTGPVTLSFLNRRDRITIIRYGKTPAQFYQEVATWIEGEFRKNPVGGTPIYRNVDNMFNSAQGQTAHYIVTDGIPTGYGSYQEDSEREIRDIKNRILGRNNPLGNPVTLMCCSTNPADTEWMHEVEEIACMPGAAPGYVSALQNFDAERLEVLNDQGAWLPYSRSVWLICSLVAALNPNDLDALDQHAPLSKPILDSFLGRLATMSEYEGYFLQHPNATWLFKEDFEFFVKTPITNQIPAVAYFENTLGQKLNYAINNNMDNTEYTDLNSTEQMLLTNFQRARPLVIFQQRQNFWGHYAAMELQQLQSLRSQRVVSQHLWADYIAYSNMGNMWQAYVQGCHPSISEVVQKLAQEQQQQQQIIAAQHPAAEGQGQEDLPPPAYDDQAISLSQPQVDSYIRPQYYSGNIPSVTVYNQSSSNQTMWRPAPQQQYDNNRQVQYGGGPDPQYNNRQYQQSCCIVS
jgi:hypothetical protein